MRWFLAVALCSCIDSNSVVCGNSEVCPGNTVCTTLAHISGGSGQLCADPNEIAACNGKQEGETCSDGVCHDGVCQPSSCGNGYVDPGEACDDHNNVSGDGCAADCKSTETCGNGVRDGVNFEECDDGNRISGDGCDSNCNVETARWRATAVNQITARKQTAMAYDPIHDQIVLFGGLDNTTNVAVNDTWLFDGTSWRQADPRNVPAARIDHSMIYDPKIHAIVMYGGVTATGSNHQFNDTWLWDGQEWHAAVTAGSPGRLEGASLAYDGKRQRVLLFGGFFRAIDNSIGYQPQTWAFDGSMWTQVQTATIPEGRARAAFAYDPLRDTAILFGGQSNGALAAKTWIFDGTDWHSIATAAPTYRYGPGFAWDAKTHTLVMFGGFTSADVAETWQWNGTTWIQAAPAAAPAARDTFAIASDAVHGKITVYGGTADTKTWQWNGTTWLDATPYEPLPTPSAEQVSFDLRRAQAVVPFSGLTLASDGDGWTQLPGSIASAPDMPAAAYDAARDQTIVYGGGTNQTWVGSPAAWTLSPSTDPGARTSARIAYDAAHQTTVLFGGLDATTSTMLGDTWLWDGASWRKQSPAHSPPPRYRHQMAYDQIHQRVVMFGGETSTDSIAELADTWTWDGTDWTQIATAHTPSARENAAITYVPRRRSVIMAGNPTVNAPDTWEWSGSDWSLLDAGIAPSARAQATAFPTRDGAMFIGGGRASGVFTFLDTWRLGWEGPSQPETCVVPIDLDGDGLAGCDDPDCYYVCNPTCLPGTTCDATQPHCGDGVCDPLETCRMCPGDCGACAAVCGDSFCDPGETAANCPGDCP